MDRAYEVQCGRVKAIVKELCPTCNVEFFSTWSYHTWMAFRIDSQEGQVLGVCKDDLYSVSAFSEKSDEEIKQFIYQICSGNI
jgi:hypothetical protein